jgi:hypothetical protein
MSTHLPFAVTAQSMRINRQQVTGEVTGGSSQFSQGDLQSMRLRDGSFFQQVMDCDIRREPWQTIDQLETILAQCPFFSDSGRTQGCLMDQLQGKSWLDALARLARPSAQQVPRPEPQMLRNQEPQSHQVARHFVRQKLSHRTLQTGRIGWLWLSAFGSSLCLNGWQWLRPSKQFFFEVRSPE